MDPREQSLKNFLNKWPISRMKNITLRDYAMGDSNSKDSFSYWVEFGSKDLGDVSGLGGGGSFKHGIFYMHEKKDYGGNKRMTDGTFAWTRKYGNSAGEAFENIKTILLKVIEAAQTVDLHAIDALDFYAPIKWKWAFLYSNKGIPIYYKHEALKIAAQQLGYKGQDDNYPTLYTFLNTKEQDSFAAGDLIYELYRNNLPRNYYVIGSKYGDIDQDDVFPEMFKRKVISTGFASHIDLTNFVGKSQKSIIEFLKEQGEEPRSYNCLKHFLNIEPGDLIAVKSDGSPKGKKGYLKIVGIGKVEDSKDFYKYDPDGLGHTIQVDWLQAPISQEFSYGGYGSTLHKLKDQSMIENIFKNEHEITDNRDTHLTKQNKVVYPLNQILYGPPGTGKTYNTIRIAAEIIEEKSINSFEEAVNIYKQHLGERITFITFHQNYSYEDFIQGIRPNIENEKELSFSLKDGVFKKISHDALQNITSSEKKKAVKRPFKEVFSEYFHDILEGEVEEMEVKMKRVSFYVTGFTNSSIEFRKHNGGTGHTLSLNTLEKMYEAESLLNIQGLSVYYMPIFDALLKLGKSDNPVQELVKRQNYVIIIDEINRANISRVFGELITLIEPDKRSHGDFPMEAKLPSGDDFLVPSNLYIIGTMNTADKSIALLDIALRRRFEFIPMYPLEHIEGHTIHEVEKLKRINIEIRKRKSEDFQIGHSYFMGADFNLKKTMNHKVIPLLLEYFMNDKDAVCEILVNAGFTVNKEIWPLQINEE